MMKTVRRSSLLAALALFSILVAGCGDDGGSNDQGAISGTGSADAAGGPQPLGASSTPQSKPGGGQAASSNPVIMYSYNDDLSFAAPLAGAWVDAEQIYVFLVPSAEWRSRGIAEVQYACCVAPGGVGAPSLPEIYAEPWRSVVDVSSFVNGGTFQIDAAVYFGDNSMGNRTAAFTLAASGAPAGTNSPPTISGGPGAEVATGGFYDFRPSASDPDGDSLGFSIENRPRWADFDPLTGRLHGVPGEADVGVYEDIVITASDGLGGAHLPAFAISVNAMSNGSATLSWTAPTQRTNNAPLTDLAGYIIRYGPEHGSYTDSITIDNPSISSYVVDNLPAGAYKFTVVALDSHWVTSDPSNKVIKTVF